MRSSLLAAPVLATLMLGGCGDGSKPPEKTQTLASVTKGLARSAVTECMNAACLLGRAEKNVAAICAENADAACRPKAKIDMLRAVFEQACPLTNYQGTVQSSKDGPPGLSLQTITEARDTAMRQHSNTYSLALGASWKCSEPGKYYPSVRELSGPTERASAAYEAWADDPMAKKALEVARTDPKLCKKKPQDEVCLIEKATEVLRWREFSPACKQEDGQRMRAAVNARKVIYDTHRLPDLERWRC